MNRKLEKLEARAKQAQQAIGRALLAQLPQVGVEYARTGILPENDLHRAWLIWVDAMDKAMAATIPATMDPVAAQREVEVTGAECARRQREYEELLARYGLEPHYKEHA